jgi:hypothetical protein
MQRNRKPETRHVYSARWVKAYVEAITNDRPVSLITYIRKATPMANVTLSNSRKQNMHHTQQLTNRKVTLL